MPGSAGDTASGAAGGAMTGAVAGSVFGPWGTVIGGVGGGILGGAAAYFGGGGQDPGMTPEQRAMYEQYIQGVMTRDAPQITNSGVRNNQMNLIGQLEAQSAGRGPSLAAAQLQSATDRNIKTQQSYANGARGSAAPLAAFQAQNNSSALGAQAAQDAAVARVAEINSARAQLGQNLQATRGADEQTLRANLEARLRAMGMNDEAIARAMATFQGSPQVASTGQQVMAAGTGAVDAYAQTRGVTVGNGRGIGTVGSDYNRTYGDDTMNPFGDGGATFKAPSRTA